MNSISLLIVSVLLLVGPGIQGILRNQETPVAAKSPSTDDFEWLSCGDFMDYLGSISTYTGIPHPRTIQGFSRSVCARALDHMKEHQPRRLELIVNLGNHLKSGRKLDGRDTKIENIARGPRSLEPSTCDSPPSGSVYEMGNPGALAAADPHTIGVCPDPSCPTLGDPSAAQPNTCIPDDTNTFFNAMNLVPSYTDASISAFEEFSPDYGEGRGNGYRIYTLSLSNGPLWSGCDQDRVVAFDPLATLLQAYLIEKGVTLALDFVCEFVDDKIILAFIGFSISLPNPGNIICRAALAVLQIVELSLETILDQASFQSGGVDGAEIQAGYLHSTNLLDKQCSIFFESACRCSGAATLGGRGTGCDGLDSNCDGDPDDCDEDQVPPDIDLTLATNACTDTFFATTAEAVACVTNSALARDDCNGVSAFTAVRGVGTCQDSSVTLEATDNCNRTSSATLPVKIDDGLPPQVQISVAGGSELILNKTGSGILRDVNLQFSASDECGMASIQIDVFANELEDFNAQVMARFAKVSGGGDRLWLAAAVCSTSSNGQCIKDAQSPKVRIYTIVVTATDLGGNKNSADATVKIVPQNTTYTIGASTQRFHLTSLYV